MMTGPPSATIRSIDNAPCQSSAAISRASMSESPVRQCSASATPRRRRLPASAGRHDVRRGGPCLRPLAPSRGARTPGSARSVRIARDRTRARGPKLLRVRRAPDARTRRAHGSFDEDRIGCDVPKIVRARNHESLRLRRADGFQRAKRGNLVLHPREACERRHDSRDAQVFPARRQQVTCSCVGNSRSVLRSPAMRSAAASQPNGSSPKRGTSCTALTCRVNRVRQIFDDERISTSCPSEPSCPAT